MKISANYCFPTIICLLSISIATAAPEEPTGNFSPIPPQISLNITVPFALKPRLYPYGENAMDHQLPQTGSLQGYVLQTELSFGSLNHSVAYISKDGAVGFKPDFARGGPRAFPTEESVIAVFWTETKLDNASRVYFRETSDAQVLSLAASEVKLQYTYDKSFMPTSLFILTWENVAPAGHVPAKVGAMYAPNDCLGCPPLQLRNTFQVALILSNNGSFAHFIYSHLEWNGDAIAGFNPANGENHFSLPWSGTKEVLRLSEYSNMGIPGEWMFKLDESDGVHMCGPGFKGTDCSQECAHNEFSYDCSKECHCTDGQECDHITGACPNTKCKAGWSNPPNCDIDIDECSTIPYICNASQPDCINTPGSFSCACLVGYDEMTNTCRGVTTDLVQKTFSNDSSARITTNITNGRSALENNHVLQFPDHSDVVLKPQKTSEFIYNPFRPTPLRGTSYRNRILTASSAPFVLNNVTSASRSPFLLYPHMLECALSCSENAHCEFVNGQQWCICNQGWTGDGSHCYDINECLLDGKCPINSTCINTIGSFECRCSAGFVWENNACLDIDECAGIRSPCPFADSTLCINTVGSYECHCRSGFNGRPSDASGCIDINECLLPNISCGANAQCHNTIGSFLCKCHPGYQPLQGDSYRCEDFDECTTHPCSTSATCMNSLGSFRCICNSGYVGNGFHCEKSKLLVDTKNSEVILDSRRQWTAINTTWPIRFLLTDYNEIFVSIFGIVTFDGPVVNYDDPNKRKMSLMPFYRKLDIHNMGEVRIHHVSEDSTLTDLATLVREVEGLKVYKATGAVVATFRNTQQADDRNSHRNTFQIVLFSFEGTTYALFVYEPLESINATIGINGLMPENSIRLTVNTGNATNLWKKSNIGVNGKWIWRIDDNTIAPCSPGYQEAPLCLKDIDECDQEENECEKNAICINTHGSYVCTCKHGYTGDGRQCFELNACYMESGAVCGENAECFVPAFQRSKPECVCKEGFIGDGFLCSPTPKIYPFQPEAAMTEKSTTTEVPNNLQMRIRKYRPMMVEEHGQEEEEAVTGAKEVMVEENGWRRRFILEHKAAMAKHFGNELLDVQNTNSQSSETTTPAVKIAPERTKKTDNTVMRLLTLLVPIVLVILWLFLTIILIRVCVKRRKSRRPNIGVSNNFAPIRAKPPSPTSSSGYETYGSYMNGCYHQYPTNKAPVSQRNGRPNGLPRY